MTGSYPKDNNKTGCFNNNYKYENIVKHTCILTYLNRIIVIEYYLNSIELHRGIFLYLPIFAEIIVIYYPITYHQLNK